MIYNRNATGQETAVSRLLSVPGTGWMVNSVDHHGNTPLMMAAKYATRSAEDGDDDDDDSDDNDDNITEE